MAINKESQQFIKGQNGYMFVFEVIAAAIVVASLLALAFTQKLGYLVPAAFGLGAVIAYFSVWARNAMIKPGGI